MPTEFKGVTPKFLGESPKLREKLRPESFRRINLVMVREADFGITRPSLNLLRQGFTPEKIALTIAVGLVLGVTPILGSATLLCTLAAGLLRLNLGAIQLVNGIVYPLQLALVIPFLRIGAWLFGAPLPH